MEAKKIILIVVKFICLNIVLIVAFLFGVYLCEISPKVIEPPLLSHDFYKRERYLNPDPFVLFSKYYYYENLGEIANNEYILVEDNVEKIKSNISITLSKLHELNNSINVEFNYDIVSSNDYYFLKNVEKEGLMILHYYDVDEHILYTAYFPE